MIGKTASSLTDIMAQINDGSTILIGGFGPAGQPAELIDALIDRPLQNLTIVSNNADNGDYSLARLLQTAAVKKIICSFPRQTDAYIFDERYRAGKIELAVVPQGNLKDFL